MPEKTMYLEAIPKKPRRRRRRFRPGRVLFVLIILTTLFYAGYAALDMLINTYGKAPDGSDGGAVLTPPQITDDRYIPESLLELLEKNPETYEFVMAYSADYTPLDEIDISGDLTGGIPLFLQWDSRWGYDRYGSDMLAITGCGPTCMSMVATGLLGDASLNPRALANFSEENGFYAWGSGTTWTFMTDGAEMLGLSSRALPLHEPTILGELHDGNPIICAVGNGDFTTEGHFIVLTGVNDDGTIRVNDPNSPLRSGDGWELKRLMKQIKNLWAFSV